MTISKLTNTVKPLDEVNKINEIIDELDSASVAIDNSTITKNGSDQLQTVAVKDSRSGNAIKTWTGTRTQYDAIVAKDATTLYFCTDSGEIYLGSVLISNKTSGKDVGDIVFSLTPKTDAGLHLLDGALIQGSGIYSAFVDYIADLYTANPSANYFTTEANWQTIVSTYGVCGKFVYDSVNNTVRLPKITGIIEGTTDITALGDLVEAGLPNITASTQFADGFNANRRVRIVNNNGAFTATSSSATFGNARDTSSINAAHTLGLDASRSSSLYKNNFNKVQPQSTKVLYYIVLTTSTKTDLQVDIDAIATDLNGKADTDLLNLNNTGTSVSAGLAMPSGTYTDLTLGSSRATYTAPANGYYILYKQANSNNQFFLLRNNTQNILCSSSTYQWGNIGGFVPCRKGDEIYLEYSLAGSTWVWRFVYAEGSKTEA